MAIKGAIIGDIIGSQFEFHNIYADKKIAPQDIVLYANKDTICCGYNDNKTAILLTDKCEFTDDTVLTLATKYAIQHNKPFAEAYAQFGKKYRNKGFGGMFLDWLDTDHTQPYNSFGNGSAMRVSYIADYYDDIEDVVANARRSAACTHNHPEGILGAEVTAACIWLAKNGRTKEQILEYVISQYPKEEYAYSPEIPLAQTREYYHWDVTCQGSVPAVIRCIYEANNYTEFIRNVLSLKCDTDTLCAIGGGIAEELFDNSADPIMTQADEILKKYLDDYLLKIFLEN